MRVIRRVYNYTFAFQSCDLEVPAVGTGSTSNIIITNVVFFIFNNSRFSGVVSHVINKRQTYKRMQTSNKLN